MDCCCTLRRCIHNFDLQFLFRYIVNPFLLNGFKADIRVYMLIAGTCPYMVFYYPGYVRLSLVPYSLNEEEIHAHLTNQVRKTCGIDIKLKHKILVISQAYLLFNFLYCEANFGRDKEPVF